MKLLKFYSIGFMIASICADIYEGGKKKEIAYVFATLLLKLPIIYYLIIS